MRFGRGFGAVLVLVEGSGVAKRWRLLTIDTSLGEGGRGSSTSHNTALPRIHSGANALDSSTIPPFGEPAFTKRGSQQSFVRERGREANQKMRMDACFDVVLTVA